MTSPLNLHFVQSAATIGQLPTLDVPEVAVVGRSNVGKSSLINSLSNRKGLAKVSKTPGRTQLINYFTVGERAAVVDLPGYGYAKVPAQVRAGWQTMIEGYLLDRPQVRMILLLVDGEIGPTRLDTQMIDWLDSHDRPWTVVATKHDKVRSSKLARRKRDLAQGCGVDQSEVVWVSASRNVGMDKLRRMLASWLEIKS